MNLHPMIVGALILLAVFLLFPLIVSSFLRNVEAGTIRMVSWLNGRTVIYRGPGKSWEIPLLTTGTTLSSKAINVDLDITDQTADLGADGIPQPIKVRVLASAIVSVGDSDAMIKTAANRFFSKPVDEQQNILIDLLSSSGRRAINLLTHDQLFSARTAGKPGVAQPATPAVLNEADDDDDPLAVIIRKACSRELTDLGLGFNSLNIKVVQSDVAEARRKQSAAEAQANAEIVAAEQTRRAQQAKIAAERQISDNQRELEETRASNAARVAEAEIRKLQAQEVAEQTRRQAVAEAAASADIVAAQQDQRAREARLGAERAISDSQRELDQTRAANAALVAEAEARRQQALGIQRHAELEATQLAQARADAERVQLEAQAQANAEAVRIRTVAAANAEGIAKVNEAIRQGGDAYLRFRQVEMLPELAPAIAEALSKARLVTIASGNEGAPGVAANGITQVIQTVLAAQLVGGPNGVLAAEPVASGNGYGRAPAAVVS
jgi:flotillin